MKLLGKQELPAEDSSAKGLGHFTIATDKSVSGSVKTTEIVGTVAHIHLGAVAKNGPPIITLVKTSDGEWSVPAGATLTLLGRFAVN